MAMVDARKMDGGIGYSKSWLAGERAAQKLKFSKQESTTPEIQSLPNRSSMMAALTLLLCISLFMFYTAAAPSHSTTSHAPPSPASPTHVMSDRPSTNSSSGHLRLSGNHTGSLAPVLDVNFADPSVIRTNGGYYAFATQGNGHRVQMANSTDLLSGWALVDSDPLPMDGWTTGKEMWAPDVRRLGNGTYVMYFTGRKKDKEDDGHCVGVARSKNVAGPYEMDEEPWTCHADQGGAIDPSGFLDETTGRRYVVYKIDGNFIGHGGDCGNSVDPLVPTPIMLQEVSAADGSTHIGDPVEILDRTDEDGPLVEAPNLVRVAGRYVLFFSSHCYNSDEYDAKYAIADEITGPYRRAEKPIVNGTSLDVVGPGGVTSTERGGGIVFHGWCEEHSRCMYAMPYEWVKDSR